MGNLVLEGLQSTEMFQWQSIYTYILHTQHLPSMFMVFLVCCNRNAYMKNFGGGKIIFFAPTLSYPLVQILHHLHVELEEKAESECLPVLHFPTVYKRRHVHLVLQESAGLSKELLSPGPNTRPAQLAHI